MKKIPFPNAVAWGAGVLVLPKHSWLPERQKNCSPAGR